MNNLDVPVFVKRILHFNLKNMLLDKGMVKFMGEFLLSNSSLKISIARTL